MTSPPLDVRLRAAALVLVLAATLSGCASPRSQVATEARTKLVGMPADDFLICMGPPAAKTREGAIDFWIYKSSARVNSAATAIGSTRTSTTAVSECTASVALRAGKVAAINYTGDVHELGDQYGTCYEIVASCMGR